MDIKKKADSLVRKFQTRNPFEIIRGLNVILVFAPLVDTRAFYQYFQRNNIIYIDQSLTKHEQAFECAHEMGHMFLHKKANAIFMDTRTNFNSVDRLEIEANKFAVEFLITDETLYEYFKYQEYTIEQVARALGYQKELIELRLKQPWAF